MQIVKFITEEEAQQIIAQKQSEGLILTNVSNVTEGNFLGFKDPDEIPIASPTNQGLVENQLILMDVLATMYEDMLVKGTV